MTGMTMTGGLKKASGLIGQGAGIKKLSAGEMTVIGGRAIDIMRRRVVSGVNLADASSKPYSTRGPIYVPVSGVKGQTKTSVKGREVITKALQKSAKAAGTAGFSSGTSQGGRSMKFANRAAYKQYLGKSGNRDLEVSGTMLRSMRVIRASTNYCAIGFGSTLQEAIARGNQRIDPWFGLSHNDQKQVAAFTNQTYAKPVTAAA